MLSSLELVLAPKRSFYITFGVGVGEEKNKLKKKDKGIQLLP